jgi:hypothetical protein
MRFTTLECALCTPFVNANSIFLLSFTTYHGLLRSCQSNGLESGFGITSLSSCTELRAAVIRGNIIRQFHMSEQLAWFFNLGFLTFFLAALVCASELIEVNPIKIASI